MCSWCWAGIAPRGAIEQRRCHSCPPKGLLPRTVCQKEPLPWVRAGGCATGVAALADPAFPGRHMVLGRHCQPGRAARADFASPATRMFLNVPSSGGLRTRHSFLKVKNLSIEGQRCVPAWERALSSQAVSHHAQPTAGFVSRPRMIWSLRYPCVRPRAALPPSVLPKSTANPRGVVIRLVETHRVGRMHVVSPVRDLAGMMPGIGG